LRRAAAEEQGVTRPAEDGKAELAGRSYAEDDADIALG
jgi:hypothetical protein